MALACVDAVVPRPWAAQRNVATIAKAVKAQTMIAGCRIDWLQVLLFAEIVTRAQDPIPASHTDSPREAKQKPMIYLARNMQYPALKLCLILGWGR